MLFPNTFRVMFWSVILNGSVNCSRNKQSGHCGSLRVFFSLCVTLYTLYDVFFLYTVIYVIVFFMGALMCIHLVIIRTHTIWLFCVLLRVSNCPFFLGRRLNLPQTNLAENTVFQSKPSIWWFTLYIANYDKINMLNKINCVCLISW